MMFFISLILILCNFVFSAFFFSSGNYTAAVMSAAFGILGFYLTNKGISNEKRS